MNARRTVLVVEDSEEEARMLERGLLQSGLASHVVIANTTTDAHRYLFEASRLARGDMPNPDLVILDLVVPPDGGLDVLHKMRADKRCRLTPVVLVSGQMTRDQIEGFYQAGANSCLEKPVDFEAFLSMTVATARYWLALNRTAAAS